jgi:hypothetical protein
MASFPSLASPMTFISCSLERAFLTEPMNSALSSYDFRRPLRPLCIKVLIRFGYQGNPDFSKKKTLIFQKKTLIFKLLIGVSRRAF